MTFEMKQCPYCGRWCRPQLVVAQYNMVAPKVTTYEVVYPCVCGMVTNAGDWYEEIMVKMDGEEE